MRDGRALRPWIALGLVLLSALSVPTVASVGEQPLDPLMGDWTGELRLGGMNPQPVAVEAVALGDGQYVLNLRAEFNAPWPPQRQLYGELKGEQVQLLDVLKLSPSQVLEAREGGLLVKAALWAGRVEAGALLGTMVGREQGTFAWKRHRRQSPTLGQAPPPGAVTLWNGSSLEAWVAIGNDGKDRSNPKPANWKVFGDELEVQHGGCWHASKAEFGDCLIHVEFKPPFKPSAQGQSRGNSGVYLQDGYKLQILDDYGNEPTANGCGAFYYIAAPRVNACLPPDQWQTYDIDFRAPRFDADGRKTGNARVTVRHNGIVIHEDLELPKPTGGGIPREAALGPLVLQNHFQPVRFRNIWVLKK